MNISRPALVRILPFAVFIAFLAFGDLFALLPDHLVFDERLLYPLRVIVVGAILIYVWRELEELREGPQDGKWLWLWAPLIGALVFVLWINLDFGWLNLADPEHPGYDPRHPETGALEWHLVIFRILGAALLVPIMEEIFWRSYLMRWIDRADFRSLAPAAVTLKAMLISSLVFGLAHTLWFAAIIAGLIYAWLYRASGSIWPPIIAHAVTNGMLGVWVITTGNWQFW